MLAGRRQCYRLDQRRVVILHIADTRAHRPARHLVGRYWPEQGLQMPGELEIVETALWYPKMYRKDYKIGLNLTGGGGDPDQEFYENYACGAARNWLDK